MLSDIVGDAVDMIASGPVSPDSSTCADALAVAEKYALRLSDTARGLLAQETPKTADNVTVRVTGSVRELCAAAAGKTVADVLQNNDAYHALRDTGDLIITGPTGTNVNDFAAALVR